MPTSTTINGFSKPAPEDSPNIETAVNTLANSVDQFVVPRFSTVSARNLAIPSPVFGMVCHCADTTELYMHDGTAWVSLKARIIRKTANQGTASDAGLSNDTHLFAPVEANSMYVWTLVVNFSSVAAADFKYTFTGPTGSTCANTTHVLVDAAGNDHINAEASFNDTTVAATGIGPGDIECMLLEGCITTAATAGNFRYLWAQNTSNVATTSVWLNSYLEIWKVK